MKTEMCLLLLCAIVLAVQSQAPGPEDNICMTVINFLKEEIRGNRVAFSASLSPASSHSRLTVGPFEDQPTLILKNVIANFGDAYNPETGIFTAARKGAYHFDWHLAGRESEKLGAFLYKNEEKIYVAYEVQPTGWSSASNSATLLLESGDTVSLRQYPKSTITDDADRVTTFSGHMLFAM